jgi:hypothetical protein
MNGVDGLKIGVIADKERHSFLNCRSGVRVTPGRQFFKG